MRKGFASNYRVVLVVIAVALSFSGIAARLVYLHVIDRDEVLKRVAKARADIIVQNARRGDIRDIQGNVLATSKTQMVLGVDPAALRPEDEKKWAQLATLINVPLTELRQIFNTKTRKPAPEKSVLAAAKPTSAASDDDGSQPEPAALPEMVRFDFTAEHGEPAQAERPGEEEIAENGERIIHWAKLCEQVEESVYDQVMKLDIKGVYGNRVYRRAYPQDGLAAHLIGYVSREGAPQAGIERYADFYLRGQNGWVVSERDGRRRELAQFRTREVAPVDGYDVVLSIDSVVQHMVEEEIKAIVNKFHPKKATIIVSDARTGFLMALGNYPNFNLNEYEKADIASLKNIALTDVLEPGSTFKIVAASGALDLGLVTPESRFDCSLESVVYKGRPIHLSREDHKFDHPLSLREILSHSSNKGAAQLAMLMGDQRFYEYCKAYNFGSHTGFPADSESRGSLRPPEKWSAPDISRMAMGHAVNGTPLQVHCAMQTIASGGQWLRPQVIREIRDNSGEVVFRFEGVAERRVIQQSTAEKMAAMLKWVTVKNEGTAPSAAIDGFEVAGKTGTTQKIVDGHYVTNKHVSSFVGFFPASRPAVVISVIVDESTTNLPLGVAYGSLVAAPSFKHIGEQLVQYLNIKPVTEPRRAGMLAMNGGRQ